jgi:hypothetical protein
MEVFLVTLFKFSKVTILTMKTIAGTRLWSEISYWKPPRTCTIKQIFPASNERWTQQKIYQWQRGKLMQEF